MHLDKHPNVRTKYTIFTIQRPMCQARPPTTFPVRQAPKWGHQGTCTPQPNVSPPKQAGGVQRLIEPKSVIRVQSDFVLLPCRLAVTFVEGVAGYVETKRQTRCRRQGERAWKAPKDKPIRIVGGLTTDLG